MSNMPCVVVHKNQFHVKLGDTDAIIGGKKSIFLASICVNIRKAATNRTQIAMAMKYLYLPLS